MYVEPLFRDHDDLLKAVSKWLESDSLVLPGVPRMVWHAPLGKMNKHQHYANASYGTKPGMPDLFTWWQGGLFLGVEVKFGKDRLSKVQVEKQQELLSLGCSYLVLWDTGRYIVNVPPTPSVAQFESQNCFFGEPKVPASSRDGLVKALDAWKDMIRTRSPL